MMVLYSAYAKENAHLKYLARFLTGYDKLVCKIKGTADRAVSLERTCGSQKRIVWPRE